MGVEKILPELNKEINVAVTNFYMLFQMFGPQMAVCVLLAQVLTDKD